MWSQTLKFGSRRFCWMNWQTDDVLFVLRTELVIEEDSSALLLSFRHHSHREKEIAWPTLEVKSTANAKPPPLRTHTQTHTCADTLSVHLVCLLTVDIAYQCPVPPAVMGQWLAGEWLLCLQHGCLIGAYVVLDLELPELHKFRWMIRPIKVAQRTQLCFFTLT